MRADQLMMNANSDMIAAFNRGRIFKARVALAISFGFAVLATAAPAHTSAEPVGMDLVVAAINEPVVDAHDFINPKQLTDATSGTSELERLFWMCDYAATAGTLQANEVEMCSAVTNQMRLAMFAGDSEKLFAWWRLSKDAEHKILLGAAVIGHCAQGDVRQE